MVATIQHDATIETGLIRDEERAAVNYDHPESPDLLLVEHLRQLVSGQVAEVLRYDSKRHRGPRRTAAARARRIVEGSSWRLRLRAPSHRAFVHTADDIRAFRRIKRDMEERGHPSLHPLAVLRDGEAHAPGVVEPQAPRRSIIPEGGDNGSR